MQAQETASENARLRQLVGWQRQTTWKLKLAKVVLREPANWWRTVQIDLGSRDGLRVNLPVLTMDGLVGRISSVSFTRSQVCCWATPTARSPRGSRMRRATSASSAPSGPLDSEFVELGYLSGNANLKPAQNVVTSGEGGIFPTGIPIGKIVDVQPVDYGLRTEARVKLAANLNALEEVWVMFP